jgi:hypothetical protein
MIYDVVNDTPLVRQDLVKQGENVTYSLQAL